MQTGDKDYGAKTAANNGERDQFERKPNFDMQAKLSRDGKYWIIKRIETWILPKKYLDVISENFNREIQVMDSNSEPDGKNQKKRK